MAIFRNNFGLNYFPSTSLVSKDPLEDHKASIIAKRTSDPHHFELRLRTECRGQTPYLAVRELCARALNK
jgi:hypothetical protein